MDDTSRDLSRLARQRARKLRKRATFPERILWGAIRDRRLAGLRFVRQEPIGPYITDFLCRERKLVIELDGDSHADRGDYDRIRSEYLVSEGYTICRFGNDDVLQDREAVLQGIVQAAGLDVRMWLNGLIHKLNPRE